MTPDDIVTRDFPPKPWDAASLAQILGETEPQPQQELATLRAVFGALGTWRLLQKTLALEARGGLLVRDGSRKRTRGGTFLFLARQWCSPQEQARIFSPGQGQAPASSRVAPVPRRVPTLIEALRDVPQLHGEECRMKTTLIGRPDQIIKRDGYVVFKLTGALAPSLPKGLPKAPPTPVAWVVMAAQKQWGKVAESLIRDPQARAIIEGYPCMEGKTLVLLAMQPPRRRYRKPKPRRRRRSPHDPRAAAALVSALWRGRRAAPRSWGGSACGASLV
jgi:hypothetical protein